MDDPADDPCALPITALAGRIREGRLTPVDLLDACLARIAAHDGRIGAFTQLNEHARAAAGHARAEIRAGNWRGPLHGVPLAIGEDIAAADMPPDAPVAEDWPDDDAGTVARLRAAGAVLIGRTGQPCAAVAAGLAAAALAPDGGGATLASAGLCGCVGLKPSFGLIGRSGIAPRAWSLDQVAVLAASVADAALLATALAGPDAEDPGSVARPAADRSAAMTAGAAGMTVGICRNHFFEGLDAAVAAAVEAAIRRLGAAGAHVVEFEIPELAAAPGAALAIALASATARHGVRLRGGAADRLAAGRRLTLEMGRLVTAADYLQAERYRRRLGERFAAVFEEVDVVATPTLARTGGPPDTGEARIATRPERLTQPWSLLGLPAITLPCGRDPAGLPIGLQLAAAPFAEATLLRAAAALEALLDGPPPRSIPA